MKNEQQNFINSNFKDRNTKVLLAHRKPYQCVSWMSHGVKGHETVVDCVFSSSASTSDLSVAGCSSTCEELPSCDVPGLVVGLPGACDPQ